MAVAVVMLCTYAASTFNFYAEGLCFPSSIWIRHDNSWNQTTLVTTRFQIAEFSFTLIFCFSSFSYVMVIIARRNQIWCWRIQKFVYKKLILMRFLLQYSLYNLIKNSTNLEASICVLFHKSSRQVLYMRRMFISDLISQLRERIKWKWKTFMYFETHMLINLCYCRCMWANQRR